MERAKDVIEEQVDKVRGDGNDTIETADADVEKTWPDRMDPIVRP